MTATSAPPTPSPTADGWNALVADGLTRANRFDSRADEHAVLRAVASEDLGLGRILDGHRNALERLLLHRPEDVPAALRREAASGAVPLGVWGADPRPEEGEPARLDEGGATVSGVKTFCSGAGLVERAIVLVRAAPDAPPTHCAYVDLSDRATVGVDETWFTAAALRSSLSHRVVFDRAPVLALLGGPGTLVEEPWFSGDALRTAVTWAGAFDAVVAGVDAELVARTVSDAEAALLARLHAVRGSVDRWLDHATELRDRRPAEAPQTVLMARLEVSERLREGLRLAAELTGSHPIATSHPAARAREDLDLLLLQHRLTPAAVRLGHDLLRRP